MSDSEVYHRINLRGAQGYPLPQEVADFAVKTGQVVLIAFEVFITPEGDAEFDIFGQPYDPQTLTVVSRKGPASINHPIPVLASTKIDAPPLFKPAPVKETREWIEWSDNCAS